jgi:hypothetical protein
MPSSREADALDEFEEAATTTIKAVKPVYKLGRSFLQSVAELLPGVFDLLSRACATVSSKTPSVWAFLIRVAPQLWQVLTGVWCTAWAELRKRKTTNGKAAPSAEDPLFTDCVAAINFTCDQFAVLGWWAYVFCCEVCAYLYGECTDETLNETAFDALNILRLSISSIRTAATTIEDILGHLIGRERDAEPAHVVLDTVESPLPQTSNTVGSSSCERHASDKILRPAKLSLAKRLLTRRVHAQPRERSPASELPPPLLPSAQRTPFQSAQRYAGAAEAKEEGVMKEGVGVMRKEGAGAMRKEGGAGVMRKPLLWCKPTAHFTELGDTALPDTTLPDTPLPDTPLPGIPLHVAEPKHCGSAHGSALDAVLPTPQAAPNQNAHKNCNVADRKLQRVDTMEFAKELLKEQAKELQWQERSSGSSRSHSSSGGGSSDIARGTMSEDRLLQLRRRKVAAKRRIAQYRQAAQILESQRKVGVAEAKRRTPDLGERVRERARAVAADVMGTLRQQEQQQQQQEQHQQQQEEEEEEDGGGWRRKLWQQHWEQQQKQRGVRREQQHPIAVPATTSGGLGMLRKAASNAAEAKNKKRQEEAVVVGRWQ